MKKFLLFALCFSQVVVICAQMQKVVGDCMVTYTVSVDSSGTSKSSLANTTKIFYVRGRKSRTDLMSPAFTQSVIYDNSTGTAIILREMGGNKYMSTFTAEKWKEQNKQYDGMSVTLANDTKNILGYECKKAIAKLKDGTTFSVFYAPGIIPQTSENSYEFQNIPGFVLQYETSGNNGQKIIFTATAINLDPVPYSKFEIPTSGYRMLQ